MIKRQARLSGSPGIVSPDRPNPLTQQSRACVGAALPGDRQRRPRLFIIAPAHIYLHGAYVGMTPQSIMFLMLQMISPPPTPPLHTDGEILKYNMMMHISSGPTLTDKVVSIDLLSRFRE